MVRCHFSLCLAVSLLSSASLNSVASAQVTVQLPTFQVTGVSTTVIVPDRGTAYLGGVTHSAVGRNSYGSPLVHSLPGVRQNLGGRSLGRSTIAGNLSINATIIDHAELDRAVLAEARRRQAARQPLTRGRSVHTEAERVDLYLQRAERAEARGESQVAVIFYRRVARHGNETQKSLAAQRLAMIKAAGRQANAEAN